jgi:hypothetical protein
VASRILSQEKETLENAAEGQGQGTDMVLYQRIKDMKAVARRRALEDLMCVPLGVPPMPFPARALAASRTALCAASPSFQPRALTQQRPIEEATTGL